MPLVQAKCTNCGGVLEVDNSNEAAVCKYCGTPFIVEKAINNYVQNISIENAKIENATINVQGGSVENYIKLAEDSLNVDNIIDAEKYITTALPLEPSNQKLIVLKNRLNCAKYKKKFLLDKKQIEITQRLKEDWSVFDFDNFIREFYASVNMIEPSNQEFIDTLYKDAFDALNSLLVYWVSHKDAISTSSKDYYDLMKSIGRKIAFVNISLYGVLSCKGASAKALDEELGQLLSEDKKKYSYEYFKMEVPPFPGKVYDPVKLTVVNKKGKEVEVKFAGSHILHRFEESYPDFNSDNLINLKAMMDTLVNVKKGCYVATCVYDSYDCPEVWTLRRYRDYALEKTWYGRAFIKTYYAISPTAVKWFGEYDWFKNMFKRPLDKMIKNLSLKGYENTPYNDKY